MIAIHKSSGFAERWVAYCKENNIDYKLVNAYDTDIINQLSDCNAFMWHHSHQNYKDVLFAKQLLYSLQIAGKKVFPDFVTGWHFDDKVGQKYLLEAIGAPMVPSYVFYSHKEALNWINQTEFPKVFKLKGGAGSQNVMLVHNKKRALKLTKKAFGKGFKQYDALGSLKERWRKYRLGRTNFKDVMKGLVRLVHTTEFAKMYSREKGYVYFQDFIPNNSFDIRVVVIGRKAMSEKRFVRKNDFRASGSGEFSYDEININAVKIALDISEKLNLQSVAFDFIFDSYDNPLIVEMSYGFGTKGISHAPGYWDKNLNWHAERNFDFCGWMVEELIEK